MRPCRVPTTFLLALRLALVFVCAAPMAAASAAAESIEKAHDAGTATVEVLARRLVVPSVDVEIFDDRPASAPGSAGHLGIGVKVRLLLDDGARVLEARPDAIAWYDLRDGLWMPIGAARLHESDVTKLGDAAVEAAKSSIYSVRAPGDDHLSPPYRAITEIRWLVPAKGPLPSVIGGEVSSEMQVVPRGHETEEVAAAENDTAPELLIKVAPTYPEDARAAGIEGKVVVEARVEPDGTVSSARVTRSGHEAFPSFDEAALEALKKWRYRPATKDGKPVPVWTTIVIAFALE